MNNPTKKEYHRLRELSCEELWSGEVPAFDRGEARERMRRVAVIRAVGVVFSASGSPDQRDQARAWLRGLLQDPEEKIRRYALTALPKLGSSEREEEAVLALLKTPATERESHSVRRTLEKIGGTATQAVRELMPVASQQKVAANIARKERPGAVRLDRSLTEVSGLLLHLHCRMGLEKILQDEVEHFFGSGIPFCLRDARPGLIVLEPATSFRLGDLYRLRCFHSVGLVARGNDSAGSGSEAEEVGRTMRALQGALQAFTEGPIRYRLEFSSRRNSRTSVQKMVDRVQALCPSLLNDARQAQWQVNIPTGRNQEIEILPRLRPDPRFAYRKRDLPAASHPPLAAAMARWAGPGRNEVVWDPFCGSGLELIERLLLGGVKKILGSDQSEEALAATRENLAAAISQPPEQEFFLGDFRDFARTLPEGSVSLIVTNPPMGRRVPIRDLPGLLAALFQAAEKVLSAQGRLIFASPLPQPFESPVLRMTDRQKIDLGGFHVHLEKYVKSG